MLCSIRLFAYTDSDMDGVEDKNDLCPNTPLTELVEITGCTIKNLVSPHNFDIVIGESYSRSKTISIQNHSLQLDYYYKDVSLQLFSSYFKLKGDNYSNSGQNNTYLNGYYKVAFNNNLLIRFKVGISFPSYSNKENKTDYSLSFYTQYQEKQFKLFGGMGYTFIGDTENNRTANTYNDIGFYTVGIGYDIAKQWYGSLGYNYSEGIYQNSNNIKMINLYSYYKLNHHWFSTMSYKYGLSNDAIKESIGVKLGYYW
jgi:hypothetical protein